MRVLLDGDATRAPRSGELDDVPAWVDDTFQRLIGRAPTAEERSAFVAAAKDRADGPEIVLFTLRTSEEYEKS